MPAHGQSLIPGLAGGSGGGGAGAQASTGPGTAGTGLGYAGGTGGGSGNVGGAGGNAGAQGTTVPNSGGVGGSAGGGAGGNGGDYIALGGGNGGGGGGGAHAFTGTSLPVGSSRTGGAGGTGGTGGDPTANNHSGGTGGGGGGGGFGAVVEANGALGGLALGLTGGAGGAGGNTTQSGYNYAGAGGTGGGGLYLSSTQNTSLTVSGIVTGGAGGAGGTTQNQFAIVHGGAGGSAIYAGNTSGITTLTLAGTAQAIGGRGGAGSSADYAGAAGPGIAGENLSIVLAAGATVRAGQTSNTTSPRNAIQFVGGTNSLELQGNGGTSGRTYATIDGHVRGEGTTTLRLTGAGGTFDLGLLNPTEGFSNFQGVTVNTGGTWIVSGTAAEALPLTVAAGTLSNDLAGATSATLSGDTTIANGARLSAHAVTGSSALTINGDLTMGGSTSALNVTLGAPIATNLITVNGDLTLNGSLNIFSSDTVPISQGTYNLISYSGSSFGPGLTVTPPTDDYNYTLVTTTPNLISLSVLANGLYWNGNTTSGNATVVGGSGTWTAAPSVTNWIDPTLTYYVASDPDQRALFSATAGTVTVDNTAGAVSATGLSFASTGYILTGAQASDTLTLATSSTSAPKVKVDGNSVEATIALPLAGTQGMEKTGAGRLILTGANTYTGNTTISAGTLQLGDGTTTGTVVGNITNNAALVFNPTGFAAYYAGAISGTGTVEKTGAGWQTLSGNNSYTGTTTVSGGLLLVSHNNALGATTSGTVVSSGATLGLFGTGLTIAEPLTLAGFGAGSFGALASISTSAGTNTVSGAITLAADASIANLGGKGDVLNLTGPITGNGESLYLASITGATNTISGPINIGSGGVGIVSGTWVFAKANNYTGITAIGAGAKLILDSPNDTTISSDVANNGTLAFDGQALNGRISGSGNIEVGSSSAYTYSYLGGVNTYTGETNILGGLLYADDASALGSATGGTTVSRGASIYFRPKSANAVISEPLTISGNGFLDSDAALVFQQNNVTYKGRITLADDASISIWDAAAIDFQAAIVGSGKTLTLSANPTSSNKRTISGGIALGSGGVEIKGGLWEFTAQNSYTGITNISNEQGVGGTLRLNGSLAGGVIVNYLGTLAGKGTSKSVTVKRGGTFSPGNSPGTFTVDGNLAMESGSVYEADVEPSGAHDLLAVSGDVSLSSGASVHLISQPGTYAASSTVTILSALGSITGSFGTVISDSPFLVPTLSGDGRNIFLTITSRSFDSLAWTANQAAVARAAQTLGAGNPVFDSILYVPEKAVPQAFNALSGEVHASAQSVFMEQSSLIRSALADRLRAAQGGVGASSARVAAYEGGTSILSYDTASPVQAVAAPATTEKFALWTKGFGNWGSFDGNANTAGVNDSTGGFLIGADATIGDGWRLGVAGGYSYTDFSIAGRSSSGNSDNWHVGLYGGKVWGPLALRTGIAYTLQDVSTARTASFQGFYNNLNADYDVSTLQAFGELGYRMDTAFASLEPYVNLAYVSLDTGGYFEQRGAAALFSDGGDMDTTFTTLGLRASKEIVFGAYEARLSGTIGWRHAFGDITPAISQAFVSSDAFTVTGVAIAEDAAVLDVGLDVVVGANATLGVAYTGQFGGGVTQNGFNATLKVSF